METTLQTLLDEEVSLLARNVNGGLYMPCADECSHEGLPMRVAVGLMHATLALAVTVFNGAVLKAVLGQRRRTPSPSTLFAANLALADIVAGMAMGNYYLHKFVCPLALSWGKLTVPCLSKFAFVMFGHTLSGYSLALGAFDRYVAIVHALNYRRFMSDRRMSLLLGAAWLLALLNTLVLLLCHTWHPGDPCEEEFVFSKYLFAALPGSHFIIVISSLAIFYWRIHREASAAAQRMPTAAIKRRPARVLIVALGTQLVTYGMVLVVVQVRVSGYASCVGNILNNIVLSLTTISFGVNGFIYSWRNTTMKNLIRKEFGKLCCKVLTPNRAPAERSTSAGVEISVIASATDSDSSREHIWKRTESVDTIVSCDGTQSGNCSSLTCTKM